MVSIYGGSISRSRTVVTCPTLTELVMTDLVIICTVVSNLNMPAGATAYKHVLTLKYEPCLFHQTGYATDRKKVPQQQGRGKAWPLGVKLAGIRDLIVDVCQCHCVPC